MNEQQFDIIFRGDIVFGHQLAEVKLRLQQLFKADAAKVDALFTGKPVPLKRNLDQASAQKYKEVLHKAGALVDVVAVSDNSAIAVTAATNSMPNTAADSKPMTLAQRLQAQQLADEQQAKEQQQAKEKEAARVAAEQSVVTPSSNSWSLAPTGSNLLQPGEIKSEQVIEVDTSFISLRPEGGNLLDKSEMKPQEASTISTPDYEIAPPGSDLVRAEEKMELPLVEIELEDWTIAEAGSDLISENEKPAEQVIKVNELHAELAPVGANLGQLKPQVKIVTPDISGISLAE